MTALDTAPKAPRHTATPTTSVRHRRALAERLDAIPAHVLAQASASTGEADPTAEATAGALRTPDARTLARWGFLVDTDGIQAHEAEVRWVTDAATRSGLGPILVQILADPREPSVARQRAFGRLALALAS